MSDNMTKEEVLEQATDAEIETALRRALVSDDGEVSRLLLQLLDAKDARIRELEALAGEAGFLLDRIAELEFDVDEKYSHFLSDWMGHVEPSIARLKGYVADYQAALKERSDG